MHAVLQRNSWKGFYAYRVLAARIPIFWPILPLLYVWPIPEIGKGIYRRVADSRTCSLPQAEIPDTTKREAISRNDSRGEQIKSVQFYNTTLWTDPEKRSQNPVDRSLIYELKF